MDTPLYPGAIVAHESWHLNIEGSTGDHQRYKNIFDPNGDWNMIPVTPYVHEDISDVEMTTS